MLGIGHRFGNPPVQIDQNESQDGECRKGGHKSGQPTAAETAEPRRQTNDGTADQEIQQISHYTRPPWRRQDGAFYPWHPPAPAPPRRSLFLGFKTRV